MAVPIDGEAAAGDVDDRVLSQGDILHQGQGGAGSFLGFRYGCVKGIEIGNALPCHHGSHRGIATAAFAGCSVHTVLGMGDDVDGSAGSGGDIRCGRYIIKCNNFVYIHQFLLPIGQSNASTQEVAQGDSCARIRIRTDQRAGLPIGILEDTAGNFEGRAAALLYFNTGVVGAAGDGHIGPLSDSNRTRRSSIRVSALHHASTHAVSQSDIRIILDHQHASIRLSRQGMAIQIQRKGQVHSIIVSNLNPGVAMYADIPQDLYGRTRITIRTRGPDRLLKALENHLFAILRNQFCLRHDAAGALAVGAKVMRMGEHIEGLIRAVQGDSVPSILNDFLRSVFVGEERIAGSQQRGQAAGSLGKRTDPMERTASELDGAAIDHQAIAATPGNAEFTSLDVQGAAGDEKGVALDWTRCAFHRAAAGDGQIRAAANLQRIAAIAHAFLGNTAVGQIQGDGLSDFQLLVCGGCSQNRQGHGRLGNPIQCIKGNYYAVIVSDSLASGDAGENLTLADCAVCIGSISSHRGMLTVIAAVGTYATIEVMGAARSDSDIGNGGTLIDVSSF